MDMHRHLSESLRSNTNFKGQNFVPAKAVSSFFTRENVEKALDEENVRLTPEQIDFILTRCQRIFSILVLVKQLHAIGKFLSQGLDDQDLPLQGKKLANCVSDDTSEEFLRNQYLLPPFFDHETHLSLSDQVVLPFLKRHHVDQGSFGSVYRVDIADGHLHEHDSNIVAIKRVEPSTDYSWKVLWREVDTLRKRQHPNIVKLLASYTMYDFESGYETNSLCMLFPYAEMNMDKWLYSHQTPQYLKSHDRQQVRAYLYECMYHLVSALSFLHREHDGHVTSHHDIKPKNILVFGSMLKLCDLGKSQLISLDHGSETDGMKGSFTYQPPECYRDDGKRSSMLHGRQFDMWSMGCVLLEIATVLGFGWESRQLHNFRQTRIESPQSKQIEHYGSFEKDDSFHNHIDSVMKWQSDLRGVDGSLQLERCLDIIIGMMEIRPQDRIFSWEAELDFFELLFPDQSRTNRLEKGALCVQRPGSKLEPNAKTPLHRAIASRNMERQRLLIEAGWRVGSSVGLDQLNHKVSASFDAVDDPAEGNLTVKLTNHPTITHAQKCLSAAAQEDWKSVTNILMHSAVQEDDLALERDSKGQTVLHLAIRCQKTFHVSLLLKKLKGFQVHRAKDELGRTALHHVCSIANESLVKKMMDSHRRQERKHRQAIIWVRDLTGQTPLHQAAMAGNLLAIKLLFEEDLKLLWSTNEIRTREHDFASMKYARNTMAHLMDNDGNSALNLASAKSMNAVVQAFKRL